MLLHDDHAAPVPERRNDIRYRELFEHSLDAVLLTAPDGRITMANSAATELFGYSETELCRLGRSAVVDPTDERLAAALDTRRRTGRFRGELGMRRKDGSRIEVELSSAIFRDDDGREWTSMFIRDISERKAREAERERLVAERDAERVWLAAVLRQIPLAVLLFRADGRLSFNTRAEQLLGMNLHSDRGAEQYRERIRFPDGRPVPGEELLCARVLRSGETVTAAEFLVQRPDGSRIPVLASAGPICDAGGRVIGAVGVFQDTSERMRALESVRASERLLNAIFQLLPVGLWLADRTGRIVRANPAGERIWAGTRFVGPERFGEYRGWWLRSGEPIAPDEWAVARALKNGETSIGELIRIQCFDDSFKIILNSALPLYDEQGAFSGAVIINEDITQIMEAEAALRETVASRDHVLSVVAHDLRNPLQVIQAQVRLLHTHGDELPEGLDRIRRQADQMDRLINDLLDVTRAASRRLTLVHSRLAPRELLEELLAAQRPIATAAGLELDVETGAALPEVAADRGRIFQVLGNLVTNAVKFTRPGGRIRIAAAPEDGAVRFSVADTGIGMEAQVLEHVFEPLWQADADRRGVGLGLAIAKAIVEEHGGRIWAESTPGEGSTFYFTLPAAA